VQDCVVIPGTAKALMQLPMALLDEKKKKKGLAAPHFLTSWFTYPVHDKKHIKTNVLTVAVS